MNRITVLLADDHQMVREGFKSLLVGEPDLEIVAEAATGRQAVRLAQELRPAVVVMDIAMPYLNGLEAARQIRGAAPETKILFLSAHSDEAYINQGVRLGVSGFLLKQASAAQLPKAIRSVAKGGTFFSPAISKLLIQQSNQGSETISKFRRQGNRLSPRQLEVLQLIAEGMPNKQVAAELGLSFKTVDKHRQDLMRKLNIHDVAGLTRYAITEGIIKNSVRERTFGESRPSPRE